MDKYNIKPKKRSKFRLLLGKHYFTFKKHLKWFIYKGKYVSTLKHDAFTHIIFEHKTPLRRHLKNVEKFVDDHKIINLSIAIKEIDGIVIRPDEVFSYWKLIGKPSKSKGYVEGMVLDHGKYKLGIGGGLCQLSNLLFWMVSHTPLDVIERHRHSYDVFPDAKRTQPFGSGATCVYNYRDFQIINNTNEAYQFNIWLDEKYLYGSITSDMEKYLTYDVYESNHAITHEFWGGYLRHNTISRRVYSLEGIELDNQALCENHAIMMYSPLLSPPTSLCEEEGE